MVEYLLLRDNIKSGPCSLEELKNADLKSTDLIWIQGKSTAWRYADEIEELRTFIHSSEIKSAFLSDTTDRILHKKNFDNKIISDKSEASPFPATDRRQESIEEIIETRQKLAEEKINDEKTPGIFSKRSQEIRKSLITKTEFTDPIPFQGLESGRLEKNTETFSSTKVIKVIIADDHTLFREGVKMSLEHRSGIKIVGEAENGNQLLHLLKHNTPDVILLDIQMPVMDGITALAFIRKRYADIKVIMLTMHNERSMVSKLMETGANAYLTKTADSGTIYEAIRTCYTKGYYFNDLTNMSMLEELHSKNKMLEKFTAQKFESPSQAVKTPDVETKSVSQASGKMKIRLLIAACAILLITSGIIAAMWISRHSTSNKIVASPPSKNTKSASSQISIPQPASQQSLSIDSAKKIDNVDSSLQKKANEVLDNKEKSLQEKTSQVLNDKDNLLQKKVSHVLSGKEKSSQVKTSTALNDKKNFSVGHEGIKKTDSLVSPLLSAIAKIDSNHNQDNVANGKQPSSSLSELKILERNNIRSFVTASVNNYLAGAAEGLSNIELTVNNRTIYTLDKVTIEVRYMLADSSLYKTETVNFQDISPRSSQILNAPKSSKGVRIEYRILSITSKELEL